MKVRRLEHEAGVRSCLEVRPEHHRQMELGEIIDLKVRIWDRK